MEQDKFKKETEAFMKKAKESESDTITQLAMSKKKAHPDAMGKFTIEITEQPDGAMELVSSGSNIQLGVVIHALQDILKKLKNA